MQVVAATRDGAESVRFYRDLFGAPFHEDISSFQFRTWATDSFFLLTIDNWHDNARPSTFGMLVPDVDAAYQRAIELGATEVEPPQDFSWKPRSCVVDYPSGNRIQLTQADTG